MLDRNIAGILNSIIPPYEHFHGHVIIEEDDNDEFLPIFEDDDDVEDDYDRTTLDDDDYEYGDYGLDG